MLSVLPIQDKNEQREACLLCAAEYYPDLLAYKLLDGDETVGVCQFKLAPEGGVIVTLNGRPNEDKFEYMLMLCRGTLNFIDLMGARYAYLDDKTLDPVMVKAIGFTPDASGRPTVDLKDFFTSGCSCH